MQVTINGSTYKMAQQATLLDALAALDIPPTRQGIAIAVCASVIPRSGWASHDLLDGDVIEIVTAAQGG